MRSIDDGIGAFGGDDLTDRFFQLDPIDCHVSTAGLTLDTDLSADSNHCKDRSAAGMWLFELDAVTRTQWNDLHDSLLLHNIFQDIIIA